MQDPENWPCDLVEESLSISGQLGSGTVARILAASWLGHPVVVKQLRPPHEILDPSTRAHAAADFRTEAAVNRALACHPNIVAFYGTCAVSSEQRLGIVFERVGDGSSLDAPSFGLHADYARTLAVGLDVARGLAHAHRKGFMHRDVKLSNVLVAPSGEAKVCDWGLACAVGDATAGKTGTDEYMAPEVFLCGTENGPRAYDEKADVFSFAILFYALLTGSEHPYHALFLTPGQVVAAVAEKNLRPPVSAELRRKPKIVDFLVSAWAANPAERPNMASVAFFVLNMLEEQRKAEATKSVESHYGGLQSWLPKTGPFNFF